MLIWSGGWGERGEEENVLKVTLCSLGGEGACGNYISILLCTICALCLSFDMLDCHVREKSEALNI